MRYLASVETSGLAKVFRYPCIGGGLNAEGNLIHRPDSVRFTGHSDDIVDVAWGSGNILFTAGGRDNAVFEWAISEAASAPAAVDEL
jgi:WD40 repeat protein